jgi:hypothetical protein
VPGDVDVVVFSRVTVGHRHHLVELKYLKYSLRIYKLLIIIPQQSQHFDFKHQVINASPVALTKQKPRIAKTISQTGQSWAAGG